MLGGADGAAQQAEPSLSLLRFREALMMLCRLERRAAKLLEEHHRKEKPVSPWAQLVGQEPAVGSAHGRRSWCGDWEVAGVGPCG